MTICVILVLVVLSVFSFIGFEKINFLITVFVIVFFLIKSFAMPC